MICIIDFGSTKTPLIQKAVTDYGCPSAIVNWESAGVQTENVSGYILSGAPVLLTETNPGFYLEKIKTPLEAGRPLLGICFGHQLLGISNGANIYKGSPVRNNTQIKILQHDPLFTGLGTAVEMMEDHTEGIDLPPGFTLLASSELYETEAMKHETKPYWGVQFHPEASGEAGKILFANFLDICKNYPV